MKLFLERFPRRASVSPRVRCEAHQVVLSLRGFATQTPRSSISLRPFDGNIVSTRSTQHSCRFVRYFRSSQAEMAAFTENNDINEPSLQLNNTETKLRDLLLNAARYMNPQNPSQLRFTGGWVRDKLLGISSHDIDVAIDDMTGYQFALQLKQYLDTAGHDTNVSAEVNGNSDWGSVGTLAKIEANPEKSKHLETVTTKIFGLDIDFVNLRKETYADDSRNPAMEFGTPQEDALRRDATINALFYNLQSAKVEDFTARGLDDLQLQIIRTPLEPFQTFKDDPLRVLRLIRFASRLQYSIDASTKDAMHDESIKTALKLKISRERIGVELDKMLKGDHPRVALLLIQELDLYATIFSNPTITQTFVPSTNNWSSYFDCVTNLFESPDNQVTNILLPDNSEHYLAWLLSAFVPYADAPPLPTKKGKPSQPMAAVVAREGIKATNKICDIVASSVSNFEEIIATKDKFLRRNQSIIKDIDPARRDILGMAIRRWGSSWRHQALFALLIDYGRYSRDILGEWSEFLEYIRDQGLLDVANMKPMIDGKAIAQALGAKPGPWMKDALDVVMAWQLRNPKTATEESALEAVREHQQKHSQTGDTVSRSKEVLQSQGELVADLVNTFLLLTIRPLFAKTAQAHADHITPQGRKVERATTGEGPNPRKRDETEDESITRPWKDDKHLYSLDLLEWIIKTLDTQRTENQWPLLIPPVLTLLDDLDPKFKTRGCNILQQLLEATPSSLLKRTGLAEVFEQALSPSLSYLPTLTPESDAIDILNAAYPALFALVSARASTLPSTSERASHEAKALTEILHQNLLTSFAHIAPSPGTIMLPYPLLTAVLVSQVRIVISRLQLDTIPQLQFLIPLLSALMTTPFASASLEGLQVLKSASGAMQSAIACSWVRVSRWRAEILFPCCEAWLALQEEEDVLNGRQYAALSARDTERLGLIVEVKGSLQICSSMLVQAVEATSNNADAGRVIEPKEENIVTVDVRHEISLLLKANTKLRSLFAEAVAITND